MDVDIILERLGTIGLAVPPWVMAYSEDVTYTEMTRKLCALMVHNAEYAARYSWCILCTHQPAEKTIPIKLVREHAQHFGIPSPLVGEVAERIAADINTNMPRITKIQQDYGKEMDRTIAEIASLRVKIATRLSLMRTIYGDRAINLRQIESDIGQLSEKIRNNLVFHETFPEARIDMLRGVLQHCFGPNCWEEWKQPTRKIRLALHASAEPESYAAKLKSTRRPTVSDPVLSPVTWEDRDSVTLMQTDEKGHIITGKAKIACTKDTSLLRKLFHKGLTVGQEKGSLRVVVYGDGLEKLKDILQPETPVRLSQRL